MKGNGATHDNDKSACDAASVCGIGNDQPCGHTSSYAWNPAYCKRDVEVSETKCYSADYPQGINCGHEDGYFIDADGNSKFQIVSNSGNGINQATCENKGICADANGVVGSGAVNDNDPTACNAATTCGPQIHDAQCVWHSDNVYTDTSSCSDDDHSTEATCLASGGCAAADGGVGGGAAHDDNKAACIAATDCGTPVPQSQCVFTQTNMESNRHL